MKPCQTKNTIMNTLPRTSVFSVSFIVSTSVTWTWPTSTPAIPWPWPRFLSSLPVVIVFVFFSVTCFLTFISCRVVPVFTSCFLLGAFCILCGILIFRFSFYGNQCNRGVTINNSLLGFCFTLIFSVELTNVNDETEWATTLLFGLKSCPFVPNL